MAEVFRATVGDDPEAYAFEMALKRLHPQLQDEKSQVDMFMTEADIGKLLRHENLVRVYESGLVGKNAFIAMEYVWGLDLQEILASLKAKRMRFPADLSIFVTMQVLRALDYVHRAVAPGGEPMDVIHRDVNPSNIYITYDGRVKLGDFGVARVRFLESLEEARFIKGKVAYVPPEVLGGAPIDQSADLWSLAVTLYEMLTVRHVYQGVSEADLVAGIEKPRIISPDKIHRDIDGKLAKLLMQALHSKPSKRPQDAVDFYQWLKRYLARDGVHVERQALGRFVRSVVGDAGRQPGDSAPRTRPVTKSFAPPEYEAPLEMTPTQRLEIVQRRRRWVLPVIIAGAAIAAGAVGWWAAQNAESKSAEQSQPAEPAPVPKAEEVAPSAEEPKKAVEKAAPVAPEPKKKPRKKRRRRRKKSD